jgi:Rieske 2Fe-2S family protein
MTVESFLHTEHDWHPRPTLSGDRYTGLDTWETERQKIWWNDWVCVGRSEEVANNGDYIVRDLAGESLVITRSDAGLTGFYNVCSHRGTKFLDDEPASGHVRKAFTCPYHGWVYNLQGELIGTPNVQQDELFDRAAYPLYRFPVEEYAGFLFVNLSRDPVRPLREHLAEGAESIMTFDRFRMDELRIGVRLVYEVDANWKILVENYNECLHCPQVHPELVQVIPLFRFGEVWDEETRDGGAAMREGMGSFSTTGESTLPKLPGLLPEDHSMYYGLFQFPNLMVNLHPDCVMYYIAYPHGPDRTTIVSEYLFRPETIADPDAFHPEPVVELWDIVSKQDWAVCERAQTGVGSRAFSTGVYPRQDRYLYAFNEQYRVHMDEPTLG